jgi:hypothetical protein
MHKRLFIILTLIVASGTASALSRYKCNLEKGQGGLAGMLFSLEIENGPEYPLRVSNDVMGICRASFVHPDEFGMRYRATLGQDPECKVKGLSFYIERSLVTGQNRGYLGVPEMNETQIYNCGVN